MGQVNGAGRSATPAAPRPINRFSWNLKSITVSRAPPRMQNFRWLRQLASLTHKFFSAACPSRAPAIGHQPRVLLLNPGAVMQQCYSVGNWWVRRPPTRKRVNTPGPLTKRYRFPQQPPSYLKSHYLYSFIHSRQAAWSTIGLNTTYCNLSHLFRTTPRLCASEF